MKQQKIVNSNESKAIDAALKWWEKNVCQNQRANNLDLEDAYAEGVIYGWNNPNWISIEDELPPFIYKAIAGRKFTATCFVRNMYDEYFAAYYVLDDAWTGWYDENGNKILNVTHWMSIIPLKKGDEK